MTTKVEVKGPIVPNDYAWLYEFLDMDYTSPKKINNAITAAQGDDLEVEINSPGGSVFDGSEIYSALKSYSGRVTAKIVGLAASAASIIAMAGQKVLISPTAQMMIHNASIAAEGDYRDMDVASELLQKVNETARNAYKAKTGLSDDELKTMMDKTTWITPDEAVEQGFADQVMFREADDPPLAVASAAPIIPRTMMKKLKDKLALQDSKPTELLTIELDLLKMRRV